MNKKKILLLDCTLRDGGMALEDLMLNEEVHNIFSKKDSINFINTIQKSKIDIIEIGSIEHSNIDKSPYSIYQSIEEASILMPKSKSQTQMYTVIYRGPDIPISSIPNWNPSFCQGARVIIRYSEIEKSLEFCKSLSEKGYKVFVQPMVTMRYSKNELEYLIKFCNNFSPYALYIVDSYGYMLPNDVKELFSIFDKGLKKNINIGLHSHNNMNLAYSNVCEFIENSSERSIIVDSTIMGMGQGAGNVQTELLVPYLNKIKKDKYDYKYVLDACEIIELFWKNNIWGYSVTNLLPAINKTAYKFSSTLRKKYKLNYAQINQLLSDIPEDYRHRYTKENTLKLIELLKIKN